jgi:hypothetical protein
MKGMAWKLNSVVCRWSTRPDRMKCKEEGPLNVLQRIWLEVAPPLSVSEQVSNQGVHKICNRSTKLASCNLQHSEKLYDNLYQNKIFILFIFLTTNGFLPRGSDKTIRHNKQITHITQNNTTIKWKTERKTTRIINDTLHIINTNNHNNISLFIIRQTGWLILGRNMTLTLTCSGQISTEEYRVQNWRIESRSGESTVQGDIKRYHKKTS